MDYETLRIAKEFAEAIHECDARLNNLNDLRIAIDKSYECKTFDGEEIASSYFVRNDLSAALKLLCMYIPKDEYLHIIDNMIEQQEKLLENLNKDFAKL
jgi:hypothetical protein